MKRTEEKERTTGWRALISELENRTEKEVIPKRHWSHRHYPRGIRPFIAGELLCKEFERLIKEQCAPFLKEKPKS